MGKRHVASSEIRLPHKIMGTGTLVGGVILTQSQCQSFLGNVGQTFDSGYQQRCTIINFAIILAAILAVIGIVLVIVGAVSKARAPKKRFTVFEIPEYTYEEFEGIALRLIKKLHPNIVVQIASSVWKSGSRDIRDVLKIAKLCNPSDGEEDLSRLTSIHQEYRKTGNDYN